MKIEEFVRLDPKQVRGDKELMQLFVEFYEAAFSFKPKCAGCSFKSGFKKLKKYVNSDDNTKKLITMSNPKTFQLKNKYRLKILTYKKDGKTYRCYGYNLTNEFANELVKAGKGDVFIKEPESVEKVEKIEVVDPVVVSTKYSDMDYRTELVPLYNKIKDETGKKAKSFKKEDVIEFLENEG